MNPNCLCGVGLPLPRKRNIQSQSQELIAIPSDPEICDTPVDPKKTVRVALDVEDSVVWLDKLAEDIWPRVSQYVHDLISDRIGPAINKALPGVLRGKLHFEEVNLGENPPIFGPISLYSSHDNETIELRLGVMLDSDTRAKLSAVGLTLGINRLKVKGEVSVVFRPSLPRPPFFGGLEVFFINPPTFDISFTGGGRIANTQLLKPTIRSTIADIVSRFLVLPNRIAVNLIKDNGVDLADHRCGDPEAVLRLTLVRAEDLLAKDFSVLAPATSDPYVVISLGATRWESPVVKKELNPVWNVQAEFPIHDAAQIVTIEVWDEDSYNRDDLIGVGEISLADVRGGDLDVNLRSVEDGSHAGKLLVSATQLSLTRDLSAPPPEGGGGAYLAVKLREVKGLPLSDDIPYKFAVRCMGVEATTKTSYRPRDSRLSYELQGICRDMLKRGYSPDQIRQILDLPEHKVHHALSRAEDGNDDIKEVVASRMKMLAATNPQFEEVVQLLIPDPRGDGDSPPVVELELLDKRDTLVASHRVELRDVLGTAPLELEGPFELQPSGASLVGSIKMLFLKA